MLLLWLAPTFQGLRKIFSQIQLSCMWWTYCWLVSMDSPQDLYASSSFIHNVAILAYTWTGISSSISTVLTWRCHKSAPRHLCTTPGKGGCKASTKAYTNLPTPSWENMPAELGWLKFVRTAPLVLIHPNQSYRAGCRWCNPALEVASVRIS